MGKTVADFYNYGKRHANMKVALGVQARDFMELFLERMESLASSRNRKRYSGLQSISAPAGEEDIL